MSKRGSEIIVYLMLIALAIIVTLGVIVPGWLLDVQISNSIDQIYEGDAFYTRYQFAQGNADEVQWIKLDPDDEKRNVASDNAQAKILALMQCGALPTFSSNELFCLAIYQSSDADGRIQELWKASFYIPSTNCTIDYKWDEVGIKEITMNCNAKRNLRYLPDPVEAVSALSRNSNVFSLCSDVAFVRNEATQEVYCVRIRVSQENLYFTLIRMNP